MKHAVGTVSVVICSCQLSPVCLVRGVTVEGLGGRELPLGLVRVVVACCAHTCLFGAWPVVTSPCGGAGGEGEEAVWKLCGVVLEKKPLK